MTAGPEAPGEILARLARVLEGVGVREWAVTGSVALGVWAAPRETRDVDLCGVLPLASVDHLLAGHDGFLPGAQELPDLVRFRVLDWDVDLFVTRGEYGRGCLARAVEVELAGVRVRVVTPEDLVVHKLFKLRNDRRRLLQDVADLRSLLTARGPSFDWDYVTRCVQPDETAFAQAVAVEDDELLLRRLLAR